MGGHYHWVRDKLIDFLRHNISRSSSVLKIRSSKGYIATFEHLFLTGRAWPFSEGGFFKARLSFPPEFPLLPPKMRFITPMWHPNSEGWSPPRVYLIDI